MRSLKASIITVGTIIALGGCSDDTGDWLAGDTGTTTPPSTKEKPAVPDPSTGQALEPNSTPPDTAPETEPEPTVEGEVPVDAGTPEYMGGCKQEAEPNDSAPQQLPNNLCGRTGPGDVDKFVFDVKAERAFVLRLESAGSVRMEVDAPCIERSVASGAAARLRLVPKRDCTIHVKITGNADEAYRLTKQK